MKKIIVDKWVAFSILAIFVGIIIFVWNTEHKTCTKPVEVPVKAQKVTVANLANKITAVGTLRSPQDIFIGSEINGYITLVGFNDGESVKAGSLLFHLDDTKEQADLLSRQADFTQAKNKLGRMQLLVKSNYVSKQDMDAARADAEAKLAGVKIAQDSLNKKTIKAPFSGMLGAKMASAGDYITAGQKLVELVDRSVLKVDFSVPEKYFQQVSKEQPVIIKIADGQGKTFNGKVTYIAPIVDTQTHTLALQASIPNPENILAPGLFVQVEQQTGQIKETILVPEQSLIRSLDKTQIFRVVNGKAVVTNIMVGSNRNGFVEVLKGLSNDDVVVVAGQQKLNDGDAVNIVS